MYSNALGITIVVGCKLLVDSVIVFSGIYSQKEKDNLEKKIQKTYYELSLRLFICNRNFKL